MKITFVKKIKIDGSPCRKCAEVQSRLEKDGHIDKIDRTIIADERDNDSEGMQLAKQYEVDRAPFFIVENDVGDPLVFTVYFKFVNEILSGKTNEEDAAKDILDSNDLDFI
jgi:methyltransferase-like protein